MKRLIICLALAALAGGCAPENLTFLKRKETAYHDSGRYMAQFTAVATNAQRSLAQAAKQVRPGEKPAIVFDIDDTILSNWPHMMQDDYSRAQQPFVRWANRSACPALPSTLALYQEARKLGIAVFFITGRGTDLREVTERNLKRASIAQYDGAYFCPLNYSDASVIPYKTACRRAIEARGYKIILNIGDQWSDLAGGHAARTFKLPNPFYFIE